MRWDVRVRGGMPSLEFRPALKVKACKRTSKEDPYGGWDQSCRAQPLYPSQYIKHHTSCAHRRARITYTRTRLDWIAHTLGEASTDSKHHQNEVSSKPYSFAAVEVCQSPTEKKETCLRARPR